MGQRKQKASFTGCNERHNALLLLSNLGAVGEENLDKFLGTGQLFYQQNMIFSSVEEHFDQEKGFPGWWNSTRIDVIKHSENYYYGAKLLVYDRKTRRRIKYSSEGKFISKETGKTLVYGLEKPYLPIYSPQNNYQLMKEIQENPAKIEMILQMFQNLYLLGDVHESQAIPNQNMTQFL